MTPSDYAALFRFRMTHPEWDGYPDEAIADTFMFRGWVLQEAVDEVSKAIRAKFRSIPLVGRLFR